jgi:hypothetical protein
LGSLILQGSALTSLRRDLKKIAPGLKIHEEEIKKMLLAEVLKREVIEGDQASKALSRVRRTLRKTERRSAKPEQETQPKLPVAQPPFIPGSPTGESARHTLARSEEPQRGA